ncbi:hypothetical protein QF046_001391 [Microbacterium sp. W4I4]|uniref:hypothetical protein n=1 Tax=Microbacterium sp. W4I4 TaxID=3042295 RepID=UPI0027808E5E|nr:hypothetical protein [Microbacterium sp. W4I4]MDQ0613750.1 hypothetical protein [Microbacterium sp. W4I4]
MTESFDVDALGLRVRIEFADDLDEAQRAEAVAAWSGALSGSGSFGADDFGADAERSCTLRAGDDFAAAMERLTVEVTLIALDALRGRSLMFHAAGVADERGRVAAFVGPSGRGKTTLSRMLGARFGYVSDETIAVEPDRSVHAYRKPLSVVREGAPKQQVAPVDAGLRDLPAVPLTLHALALLDRDASLDAPRFEPISLAAALPELVPQMSYLRDHERPLQAIAELADAVGGVRILRYPDASTVPALLPALLDAPSTASTWDPVEDAVQSGPFHSDDVQDAILTDGYAVVMAGAQVQVLDGIAPTIWLAARAGHDLDGIVSVVEAQFGAPPEGQARDIVADALDELIAADLLGRRGDAS